MSNASLNLVPMFDPPRCGWRSAGVGWIVAENGCHIWQGTLNGGGYGQVWVGGLRRVVHRLRYEQEIGPIPEGTVLDHFVCDNRQCCNPEHVRPASHRENILRGTGHTAANAAKTHCPQGHPYAGDNVRVNRRGRYCRACQRDFARAKYHRKRPCGLPTEDTTDGR